jgi:hypothetical protein
MAREIFRAITELVRKAASLARSIGIPNLLQPGLVKEMIVADILGHRLITSKRHADACDPGDVSILYEYLSCKEGGTGQIDRLFKEPPAKRTESLERIRRNKWIYLAVFSEDNQTEITVIYELDPEVVLRETERQLDASKNAISHVGFSEAWAKRNGKIVFPESKT